MDLGAPLVVASVLAFVAFLIWNTTRANLERRRLQLDAQGRVLEKIGSGQALADFLKTEEGRRFFEQLAAPQSTPGKDTRRRILVLTTLGLIALFGGLVFVNAALIPNLLVQEPSIPADLVVFGALPAFLLTGAGVGALVAAWFMHRLSKKWGHVGGSIGSHELEVAAERGRDVGPLRGSTDIPSVLPGDRIRAKGLPTVAV
jgi:hypothetical protein